MARNLIKPLPKERENLTLTARDIKIIRAAHLHRFITTDQIMVLTGAISRDKINKRTRQLWRADYLDRPEFQRQLFSYADKRPTVHALGQRGADWLTAEYKASEGEDKELFPETVRWRAKNKNIKSAGFILHTLGVTETMLQAEREVQTLEYLRLVDRFELWLCSPRYNPKTTKPHNLPTVLNWPDGSTVRRSTIPDDSFVIIDNRGERPGKALFFLEYDRNTEDYIKSSATQSSILQKLLGYADVYERKLHTERYGYKRFRVLFVIETGGQNRIDNMIAVYQSHVANQIPAGAFLFTTVDKLKKQGFFAPIWLNGKSETVSLLN